MSGCNLLPCRKGSFGSAWKVENLEAPIIIFLLCHLFCTREKPSSLHYVHPKNEILVPFRRVFASVIVLETSSLETWVRLLLGIPPCLRSCCCDSAGFVDFEDFGCYCSVFILLLSGVFEDGAAVTDFNNKIWSVIDWIK